MRPSCESDGMWRMTIRYDLPEFVPLCITRVSLHASTTTLLNSIIFSRQFVQCSLAYIDGICPDLMGITACRSSSSRKLGIRGSFEVVRRHAVNNRYVSRLAVLGSTSCTTVSSKMSMQPGGTSILRLAFFARWRFSLDLITAKPCPFFEALRCVPGTQLKY